MALWPVDRWIRIVRISVLTLALSVLALQSVAGLKSCVSFQSSSQSRPPPPYMNPVAAATGFALMNRIASGSSSSGSPAPHPPPNMMTSSPPPLIPNCLIQEKRCPLSHNNSVVLETKHEIIDLTSMLEKEAVELRRAFNETSARAFGETNARANKAFLPDDSSTGLDGAMPRIASVSSSFRRPTPTNSPNMSSSSPSQDRDGGDLAIDMSNHSADGLRLNNSATNDRDREEGEQMTHANGSLADGDGHTAALNPEKRPSSGHLPDGEEGSHVDSAPGLIDVNWPTFGASSPPANGEDPNEDFCAVCHNGGDMLCCDRCPKVYHLKCHVPIMKDPPNEGVWICGLCSKYDELMQNIMEDDQVLIPGTKRKAPTGLLKGEIKLCERIMLDLFTHPKSVPFHSPVPKNVPHYYRIITQPMDFTNIKCKLSRGHFNHYATIDDFISDVRLVFENCRTFNQAGTQVYLAGEEVSQFFESIIRKYLPDFTPEHMAERPRPKSTAVSSDTETGSTDSLTTNGPLDMSKPRPNKRKKPPERIVHYK